MFVCDIVDMHTVAYCTTVMSLPYDLYYVALYTNISTVPFCVCSFANILLTCQRIVVIDLSTARPKWRLDGPALSGHLLYSLVNHAHANRYHHHLFR